MGKSILTSGKSFGSPIGTDPGGLGGGIYGIGAGGGIVWADAILATNSEKKPTARAERRESENAFIANVVWAPLIPLEIDLAAFRETATE